MTTIPQTGGPSVVPEGVQLYADAGRANAAVREVVLTYRHKRPGPRDRQWALVTAALDSLTAAGMAVAGPLEIRLTPQTAQSGRQHTAETPYVVSIRVPVTPTEEQQAHLSSVGAAVKRAFSKEG